MWVHKQMHKTCSRVLIIAEAGVNHNGSEKLAFELVDKAIEAGVDIVKFQTFKTENLVIKSAHLANYQSKNGVVENSQFDMLKKLELSYDFYFKLVKYCQQRGIEFLSTAFDFESLYFLVNELKLTTLKIPSGEITNAPFVLAHAQTGCKLIVSTGMCDLVEVENALSVIAFGLLNAQGKLLDISPHKDAFYSAYQSEEGQVLLAKKVTLLHCTTEYPAAVNDINLMAMKTMRKKFKLPMGYSDHSEGITIAIAAVAQGAQIIEKHFTLDKNMPGPDHQASLEPTELLAMVKAIRSVELAMGNGIKQAVVAEIKNIAVARKSLVAEKSIKQGELFTPDNISMKRPGTGMSPYSYWALLEQPASRDYCAGELLKEAT